ncbi:hypothetical protein HOK51_05385 [Candidatus Woesearchaeota archaeon]|jgi:hypothetical protein|nr:hypothetical protein [Candidatus Woesearchaeota archaeon]MBT6519260.1 hypothetical protein [Candidatus Woesearchaeota archaeon]MBT7368452.1 hypothetical protein [Candidatus Woesearchaeota archaeon]
MILTKSNWTIAMLSLLVGASSCFVSSVDLPVKSFESSVKFPQKVAGETDRQFGKRVCGEKGEGSHTMIPGVDLNDRYQVTCEEHGGFIVYNLNTDELNQFDYPKPVKLSKDQIAEYVADKKVVLFGEEHSEKNRWQTLLFADMVPELKKAGVTHIGLELDRRYQNDIDQYMQNPNFLTQEKLLDELPFLHDFDNEDFVLKINAALDNGLEVMCLDNRDPDRKISRDAHMKKKIDEVISSGGKLAGFLGAAHVRWSKESSFYMEGGEVIGGLDVGYMIRPVGRKLVDAYGTENVGLVNLDHCFDQYIFACVETPSEYEI